MRAIRIFWKPGVSQRGTGTIASSHLHLKIDNREWVGPENVTPTTNFMFVGLPLMLNVPQACIDVGYDGNGKPSFAPAIYTFTGAGISIIADVCGKSTVSRVYVGTESKDNLPLAYVLYDPAPRWLELLLEIPKEMYAPYLGEEDGKKSLMNQWLYANHGPLLPSLAPNSEQRVKLAICISWPEWQVQKLTWAERAFWLQREGITLNSRDASQNINSLKQICGRWQLKMSDKLV